ncbi:MAG: phosphatase PAP2 family protein [Bacteroidales bacterium]
MLTGIDHQLFLFLNSFHSPFWDMVMTIISYPPTWIPLYIAILIFLVIKYKRRMIVLVIVIALLITASDQLSDVIKNSVKRPRPCYEKTLEGKVHTVNGRCGGMYGFVSSHASNSFAVALLSLLMFRRRWFSISIVAWALAVGYSRIYLGVHYPGDVLFGSLFGALTGWAAFLLFDFTDRRLLMKSSFFYPVPKET